MDMISPIPTESNATVNDDKNNKTVDLEREEGEIIEDEFEDIISSDEELSMRKRIEELEARNAELEKIANISGVYNYETSSKKDVSLLNDRNIVATIDLSEIDDYTVTSNNSNQQLSSFTSFSSKQIASHLQKSTIKSTYPKKDTHRNHNQYSRYEIAENYDCIPSRRNSSNKSRRYSTSPEFISRSESPILKNRVKKYRSSGKSRNRKNKLKTQNSKKSVYEDLSSSDDNKFYTLNRNELRLALKRDTNTAVVSNSVSLDKKLFPNATENDKICEQEKLNIAVSNEALTNNNIAKNNDEFSSDDSVSLEEQELRLIALKSAVVKKHLDRKKRKENEERKPYSPSDFDNIKITPSPNNYDTIGTGNSMDISPIASPESLLSDHNENTKPIDMDIANTSDSDEVIFVGQNWMPIHEIPLPNEFNIISPPQMPIIHSPQPRKLLNNEDTLEFINSLIDPKKHIQSNHNQFPEQMNLQIDEDTTKIIIHSVSSPEPTDEEELALRTLLLAKMNNSPKIINKNNLLLDNSIENINQINSTTNRHSKQQNSENVRRDEFNLVESEVDALKNLILNTMKPTNKTATVLKEAVRRLKNSSNELNQSNNCHFNEYFNYQKPFTNTLPENINLQNNFNNICQTSDPSSYLVNNENFEYDIGNFQLNQQHLLEPYFQENHFQSMQNFNSSNLIIHYNPNNREINRPALKLVPVIELTNREKLKNNRTSPSNDNLIKIPIEPNSANLTEIPLKDPIVRNENENSTESNKNISEELNSSKQADIIEILNSPKPEINVEKLNRSLEISKQIETLKQLSNSIEQTTEISKKTKIPLARKSAPSILSKKPATSNTVVTKKIVNANKVINQQSTPISKTIKRNILNQGQDDGVIKKSRVILPPNSSTNKNNSNLSKPRLVTNIEIPTVNKMIIHLGNSSATDTEDEFYEMGNQSTVIENKYFDNASPMSVQMDSPYYSPNPSTYNSPCPSVIPNDKPQTQTDESKESENCENDDGKDEETVEKLIENKSNEITVTKSIVNEVFQAKLDQFLKNARTKVETVKKVTDVPVAIKTLSVTQKQNPVTPLAVRHLPESSQTEYRRLVSRMKMLEKQKQSKKSNGLEIPKFKVTINNEEPSTMVTIKKTITNDIAVSKLSDDSLIRKVLIKNTTNTVINPNENKESTTSIPTVVNDPKNIPSTSKVVNSQNESANAATQKADLLKRHEIALNKNSVVILENIEKAVKLVNQGKEAKINKHLTAQRLAKLNKEVELCKKELKGHSDDIKKIYPSILNLHKLIDNCKIRRLKLHKATNDLGKSIKGDNYSLDDAKNKEIDDKYKNLSTKIYSLKNLKVSDINNFNIDKNKKNENENNEKNNKTSENINGTCENSSDKIDNTTVVQNVDNINQNNENSLNLTDTATTDISNKNCAIQLEEIHVSDEKLVSQIENLNEKAENIDVNIEEDNENTTEKDTSVNIIVENINITSEIFFERNIATLLPTNLNQEDTQNKGFNYTSPLDYKDNERQLQYNPNDIICPYQLMGQCDDKDCKYGHLTSLGTNKINDDDSTFNGAHSK